MTAREFAESLLNESSYQVHACLKDASDADFNAKPIPVMMSIRECVEHLIECTLAVQTMLAGEKYNWGSYSLPANTIGDALAIFDAERAKAVSGALDCLDENPSYVKDFLIAHEFYHVGQLCSIRIALNPDWDFMCIYNH